MIDIFFIVPASLAGCALLLAGLTSFRSRRSRLEIKRQADLIESLEKSVREFAEKLDQADRKAADYARRVAWLESRSRRPSQKNAAVEEENAPESTINTALAKSTITERRHRVLKLHSHGQDAERIAAQLGMLAGEVELILNLNKGFVAA